MARMRPPSRRGEGGAGARSPSRRALVVACRRQGACVRRASTTTLRDVHDRHRGAARPRWPTSRWTTSTSCHRVVLVWGKGRRQRHLPLSPHHRPRARRPLRAEPGGGTSSPTSPWLRLGLKGKLGTLGGSGIGQVRHPPGRGGAGIGHVHPHQLRHTFAHHYLADGGNEGDLMRVGRVAVSRHDGGPLRRVRRLRAPPGTPTGATARWRESSGSGADAPSHRVPLPGVEGPWAGVPAPLGDGHHQRPRGGCLRAGSPRRRSPTTTPTDGTWSGNCSTSSTT